MEELTINGVAYYRISFQCSVCLERENVPSLNYWTHISCGGDIYVGSNACYYCMKFAPKEHVMKCKYKCPTCSSIDYNGLGEEGALAIAEAVGIAISGTHPGPAEVPWFIREHTCFPWLREFLANLRTDLAFKNN